MKRFTSREQKFIVQFFGWAGAALILGAYFLVSFEIMRPDSISWQVINLTGAMGLIAASFSKRDWQPVALNIIFALVAIVSILNLLLR